MQSKRKFLAPNFILYDTCPVILTGLRCQYPINCGIYGIDKSFKKLAGESEARAEAIGKMVAVTKLS